MVVGVTTGLVEFDTNFVTSMVSDATKNVLQLNLDAQEYMDRPVPRDVTGLSRFDEGNPDVL